MPATWNLLITLVIKQFTLARWSCWRQDQTQEEKLRYNCQRIGLTDDGLHNYSFKFGSMGRNLRFKILWFTVVFAISQDLWLASKITFSMRPVTVVSGRSTAPTSNFMLRPRAKRTLRAWRRLARVTASRDLSSDHLVRSHVSRPLERRT